ncbi:hypothetical protein GALMADRAFT_161496 [Galerina marginata CBS 339.88]|uniref:Uncharacterized protein n=1 Tax=Galerina marginata (strain CBS 339.88) TaxID=685588 RepID=A0A067SA33_GALM3|nr:hypothetical protein GALMADRAFT_161496 [Galerina marginata CBS 339.88]
MLEPQISHITWTFHLFLCWSRRGSENCSSFLNPELPWQELTDLSRSALGRLFPITYRGNNCFLDIIMTAVPPGAIVYTKVLLSHGRLSVQFYPSISLKMSTQLVPGRSPVFEKYTIGLLLSAVAYGFALSLYISCIRGFLKGENGYSNFARRVLVIYTSLMLLLGTMGLLETFFIIMTNVFKLDQSLLRLDINIFLVVPFTIWGADGFMVWRCAMLYQNLRPLPRAALLCFLVLLCLISLGSGIATFFGLGKNREISALTLLASSTIANISISALIVLRLLHHQRYVQKVLGTASGSVYTKIMTMCVESCSLIAVFDILSFGLYWTTMLRGTIIPISLLPQVCVISLLLLVDRVARGREARDTPRPLEPAAETSAIRFANPVSAVSA